MWYPLVSCFKKTLILRMIRDSFCKELGANMTIAKCLRDCQLHAPLCINSKKSSWCFFFGWVEESCRQKLKKKASSFQSLYTSSNVDIRWFKEELSPERAVSDVTLELFPRRPNGLRIDFGLKNFRLFWGGVGQPENDEGQIRKS